MVKGPHHSQSQPYAHLTRALHAVYEWLRVPTTANHSLTHALRTVYEWLRVPTTANHSLMCALRTPYMQFMNG